MTLPSTTYLTVFTSDPQYGGDFAAALADATSNNATLAIDSPSTLLHHATVTVPLIFAGGSINLSGLKLTISELNAAPLSQQIFSFALEQNPTDLTITTLRTPLSLEMFGGGSGATDVVNLLAFNAVAAVALSNGGATVILGAGTYSISDTPGFGTPPAFTDTPGLFIQGAGIDQTILQRSTGGTANPVLWFESVGTLIQSGGITGCTIDGNGIAEYCLRHTSCQQMTYSNLKLINATDIAWYWDCQTDDIQGEPPNNLYCLVTGLQIDQSKSKLADYPYAGGLYLDGAGIHNTGQCTFGQVRIQVNMGDAFTFGFCGDNTVVQCATFATGGRGVVFTNSPAGTNAHNILLGLQTATAGIYALAGEKNFAILDTGNGGDANPPYVLPGAEFTYINEVFISGLVGYGLTSTDAVGTLEEEGEPANDYIQWRQNATFNTTATFGDGSPNITISGSTAGIAVNMFVTDTTTPVNIPPSTYVTEVAGNSVMLSQPTSGASSGLLGDSLTFSSYSVVNTTGNPTSGSYVVPVASTVGIVLNMLAADLSNPGNIPTGATVSDVAPNASVTLSAPCAGTSSGDQLSFTLGSIGTPYPWPIPLDYAGNFVSSRYRQLALADSNGNLWQQVIETNGSLSINSRSVLSGSVAVLTTPQLAVTASAPLHSLSPGVKGQIATDHTYVYWCIAPNQWVRAAYTSNTW